mmetsp:Transcript_15524/g.42873  ORF Transcript_15524/g.42873 Transcript_15524/m.42873 type:complete len:107 (+) Transcript_15524:237-557(+)
MRPCAPLSDCHEDTITTVFRRNAPVLGPYSQDSSDFLSGLARTIFDSVGGDTAPLEQLEATFFPVPRHKDDDDDDDDDCGMFLLWARSTMHDKGSIVLSPVHQPPP